MLGFLKTFVEFRTTLNDDLYLVFLNLHIFAAGETVGRAMAAFEATAANQISLRVGDLVRIHNTSPGGWWEGELNRDGVKQSGWFPGNYIQVSFHLHSCTLILFIL